MKALNNLWKKIVNVWNESLMTLRNLELLLESVALVVVAVHSLTDFDMPKKVLTAAGLLILFRGSYEFIRFIRSAKPNA